MKITKFFALLCATAAFAAGCETTTNEEPKPEPGPVPEPTPGATLEIEVNKERIIIGNEVSFTVTMDGVDVTAAETLEIYETKNYSIVSNPYKPTELGKHEFYAMYGSLVTEKHAVVEVTPVMEDIPEDPQPENTTFNHRILLIDHTGSGCGYCPQMMTALRQLSEDDNYNTKYNEVTAHYGSLASTDNAKSDAAAIVGGNIAAYIKGFPALTYNFLEQTVSSQNISVIKREVDKLWNKDGAEAGITAVATLGANTVTVNYEVKSAKEQEYRVSVWLLESDIYSKQNGASADWQHYAQHAIRNITGYVGPNDLSGDSIGTIAVGERAQGSADLAIISPSWVPENMDVLVIVSAPSEKFNGKFEVVNTALCPVGGTVEYEYL